MERNICILGGGAMGTACASVLCGIPEQRVRLWVRNPTFAGHIAETRENSRLLPGVRLPESVQVTADLSAAIAGATLIAVCVPTRSIRPLFTQLAEILPKTAIIVSAAKGIEAETLACPSQIIAEFVGCQPIVALGGPCHAEEVALGKPASIVAASKCSDSAAIVQAVFSNHHLRVYSNPDCRGVELAGALKNVIAIAAGICDGLDFGDNSKSALITRGLAEMVRFGEAMGAAPETFYGLAGIGDLVATCGSRHSRNRRVGEELGRGRTLEEIRSSMHAVAEGVFTARSVEDIASQQGIDMPIAHQVHDVIFCGKSPREATMELMQRPLKEE